MLYMQVAAEAAQFGSEITQTVFSNKAFDTGDIERIMTSRGGLSFSRGMKAAADGYGISSSDESGCSEHDNHDREEPDNDKPGPLAT
jgi:hypothetical protein